SLIERSLNFELVDDVSSNARVTKFIQALSSTESSYYLLGSGHENTAILWYDGLFSNVIVFSGFVGLTIFLAITFQCLRRMSVSVYFLLLVIASIISEFLLLSFLVGFVLLLSIAEKSLTTVCKDEQS
ncbi:hypothetical protein, partial [Vibrio sp. M260118]|uniref:hypothetical protein n=1 Tax=Vibrio sp. M260118 TaxID=3020896 RepID=UPI002F4205FC